MDTPSQDSEEIAIAFIPFLHFTGLACDGNDTPFKLRIRADLVVAYFESDQGTRIEYDRGRSEVAVVRETVEEIDAKLDAIFS